MSDLILSNFYFLTKNLKKVRREKFQNYENFFEKRVGFLGLIFEDKKIDHLDKSLKAFKGLEDDNFFDDTLGVVVSFEEGGLVFHCVDFLIDF